MRRYLLLPISALVLIALSPGVSYGSRFDFTGAGFNEVVVWDGDYDVSTQSNVCNLLGCNTDNVVAPDVIFLFSYLENIPTTRTYIRAMSLFVLVPNLNPLDCIGFGCQAFTSVFTPDPCDDGDPLTVDLCYEFGSADLSYESYRQDQGAPDGDGLPTVITFAANVSCPDPSDPLTCNPATTGQTFTLQNPTGIASLLALPDVHLGMHVQFCQLSDLQTLDQCGVAVPQQFRSFTVEVQALNVDATAVPEPATMMLLGPGLASAWLARRRRARS